MPEPEAARPHAGEAPPAPSAGEGARPGAPQEGAAPDPAKRSRIQVAQGFIAFQCWKLDPAWRRLDAETRAAHVAGFLAACDEGARGLKHFAAFSTAGLKADVDFILWAKASSLDAIHELALAQRSAELSRWMGLSHNYLAMLKGSPYDQEDKIFKPADHYKYLFLYPFVKTRQWYLLPIGERMRIMRGHIDGAGAYPMVKINTSYSFGIDDQDFIVAFESNEADKFVNLVQELRETESSLFTQRDTPMYVGVQMPLSRILATF
jgi:chlorite dismutase